MKIKLLLFALIFTQVAIAQIPTNMGFELCGEFSEKNSFVKAQSFLLKESRTIEEQKGFLSKDNDNNVSFQYQDISVVISKDMENKIRIFWNGFDADWDNWAFTRTKRTLENNFN